VCECECVCLYVYVRVWVYDCVCVCVYAHVYIHMNSHEADTIFCPSMFSPCLPFGVSDQCERAVQVLFSVRRCVLRRRETLRYNISCTRETWV